MKRVFIFCVCMGLCGCITQRTSEVGDRRIADPAFVSAIKQGMTKAQVKALVGEPVAVDFTDAGNEKLVYSYTRITMGGSAFALQHEMVTHTLTVLCDKDGKVLNVGSGIQRSGDLHSPGSSDVKD